ncbi:PHD finger protein 8, partial [Xenotaenia resolanae]
LPRKLPRAKPCSDPNRIREPGEVDFDIEVSFFVTDTPVVIRDGPAGVFHDIMPLSKNTTVSQELQKCNTKSAKGHADKQQLLRLLK